MALPPQYLTAWIRYNKPGGVPETRWVANRFFFTITGFNPNSQAPAGHVNDVLTMLTGAYRHILTTSWGVASRVGYGHFTTWGTVNQAQSPGLPGLVAGNPMPRGYGCVGRYIDPTGHLPFGANPFVRLSGVPIPWLTQKTRLNAAGKAAYAAFWATLLTPLTSQLYTSTLCKLSLGTFYLASDVKVSEKLGYMHFRQKHIGRTNLHTPNNPGPL